MILLTPQSTLFPYTTLFRSELHCRHPKQCEIAVHAGTLSEFRIHLIDATEKLSDLDGYTIHQKLRIIKAGSYSHQGLITRSEEHTSELQSRQYLVCRLLLEK